MLSPGLPSTVAATCRTQTARMLTLIEELVCLNSFSHHPEGGTRVAAVLERELATISGVTVKLLPSPRFAPHVVATTAGAQATASGCVGLVGHHDTVFPPGTFEGFRLDGNIARGPGVLDMKGGLVVAITALRLLAEHGAAVPIRFVIVADEEIGSPEGGGVLSSELDGAAAALVFEAGRAHDSIITARKGTGSVRVSAAGERAIVELARFVDRAQRLTDYERGVTLNVGQIEGDTARAHALIDLRFVTRADGEAVAAELRRIAGEMSPRLVVEGGVARPPLERDPANVALFREYAACAAASGLGAGESALVGGGSDASTTAALGIASIDGLGPRGTGFHTSDELIEVATLPQRLEALVRFLWARQA